MADDIVERLESCLKTVDPTCTPLSSVPRAYIVDAADLIARQRGEIGRLMEALRIAKELTGGPSFRMGDRICAAVDTALSDTTREK